jgi:NADPH:quinone reductase-like Zn-dependent oxidoreductase
VRADHRCLQARPRRRHVIDYSRDDWADGTRRYDLILDIAGDPPVSRLGRARTPRGAAVFVGGVSSSVITGMRRQVGTCVR